MSKSKRDTTPSTGQCLCGKIKLQISGKPLKTNLCVCSTCVKASGSCGQLVSIFSKKQVKIDDPEGFLKEFHDYDTDSGKLKIMTFCSNCGQGMVGYPTAFGVAVVRSTVLNDQGMLLPGEVQWGQSGNDKLNERIKSLL